MKYKKIKDSTKFYYGKQEDYSKYRPKYPSELFKLLEKKYNLSNKTVIELGAGTGKFSKQISKICKELYCVEPNKDMINMEKNYCKKNNNIIYINKKAENTKLEKNIADIVFAVQSFHWFNKRKLKKELKKILKPNGYFCIIWNNLEDDNNIFSKEYFKYINEWKTKLTKKEYQHKNIKERELMYKDKKYTTYTFIHSKQYTLKMLIGLSKSMSFAPKEDEKYYNEYIKGIIDIYHKYKINNKVQFDFHTEMYIGNIN